MSHSFTDAEGRPWSLSIDVLAAKRVKGDLGLDLLADVDDVLLKLGDNPILLVDVLFVLCRPQAVEQKISDEEFGRALKGDCLEQAAFALMQEIADFFPKRKGAILRKLLSKGQDLTDKQMDMIEAKIDPLADAAMQKFQLQLDREIAALAKAGPPSPRTSGDATAGAMSTNSPALSESTPTD